MARSFTASTHRVQVDVAPVIIAPLSLSIWGYHGGGAVDSALFVGDKDVSDNFWAIGVDATDHAQFRVRDGNSATAVSSTTFSTNTWFHLCGVETSATSRAAFLNGGGKGTNTTSKTPDNADRTTIGRLGDSSPTNQWTGRLAEGAIWNVVLTDDEVVALASGWSPLRVRPGSLIGYWPLYGLVSPEPDYSGSGNNLTNTGSAHVDHPPVAPPFGVDPGWQGAFTVAAAGISIPVVYHHRQRNF